MTIWVVYHDPCIDGFMSAYVLHKIYPFAEYVPMAYGKPLPFTPEKQDRVIFADFSLKRPEMLKLAETYCQIFVFDHHQSAENELVNLPPNIETIFDKSECGASLIAKVLNIELDENEKTTLLYVKDRDLYIGALKATEYMHLALLSLPKDFDVWEKEINQGVESLISKGSAIAPYKKLLVDEFVKSAILKTWRGYQDIPVVNCPDVFATDVLAILAVNRPFAVSYWVIGDRVKYSLRSNKNSPSAVDVAELAQSLGGGGHKNASGFTVPSYTRLQDDLS